MLAFSRRDCEELVAKLRVPHPFRMRGKACKMLLFFDILPRQDFQGRLNAIWTKTEKFQPPT
jgi:hypothetical protein